MKLTFLVLFYVGSIWPVASLPPASTAIQRMTAEGGAFEQSSLFDLEATKPEGLISPPFKRIISDPISDLYVKLEAKTLIPAMSKVLSPYRTEIVLSFLRSIFNALTFRRIMAPFLLSCLLPSLLHKKTLRARSYALFVFFLSIFENFLYLGRMGTNVYQMDLLTIIWLFQMYYRFREICMATDYELKRNQKLSLTSDQALFSPAFSMGISHLSAFLPAVWRVSLKPIIFKTIFSHSFAFLFSLFPSLQEASLVFLSWLEYGVGFESSLFTIPLYLSIVDGPTLSTIDEVSKTKVTPLDSSLNAQWTCYYQLMLLLFHWSNCTEKLQWSFLWTTYGTLAISFQLMSVVSYHPQNPDSFSAAPTFFGRHFFSLAAMFIMQHSIQQSNLRKFALLKKLYGGTLFEQPLLPVLKVPKEASMQSLVPPSLTPANTEIPISCSNTSSNEVNNFKPSDVVNLEKSCTVNSSSAALVIAFIFAVLLF